MNKLKYLGAILIAVAGLCPGARADTYLGEQIPGYAAHYTAPADTYLVGTVIPGQLSPPGQVARDVAMTNYLLNNPGQTTNNGSLYSSTGLYNSGPATAVGALTSAQLGYSFPDGFVGPVSIDLNHTGTFTYLVVAYDGPNSGVAVWNISSLTGTISFDAYGRPDGTTGNLLGGNLPSQYRITSFTLLNPTSAPDGGATVMLLGAALGGLGMARRYLKR